MLTQGMLHKKMLKNNERSQYVHENKRNMDKSPDGKLGIPMKVVSDSDLIPVTGSEMKLIVFGAKRRWRSYGA